MENYERNCTSIGEEFIITKKIDLGERIDKETDIIISVHLHILSEIGALNSIFVSHRKGCRFQETVQTEQKSTIGGIWFHQPCEANGGIGEILRVFLDKVKYIQEEAGVG